VASDKKIAKLTERIYLLEKELAELRAQKGIPPQHPRRRPKRTGGPARREGPALEANLGAWLARAGVVAILLGTGFAFIWAVDRGVVGPWGRVLLGLLASTAFIAWGEWSLRREWDRLAQTVAGGGIALAYLSILASIQLYDLVPVPVAFTALVAVTVGAAWLAFRYDSMALAVVATVGGLLNAVLLTIDEPRPVAAFLYVVALSVIVLMVSSKRWELLDRVALGGTAVAVLAITPGASFAERITFSTLLMGIFVVLPIVREQLGRPRASLSAVPDVLILAASGYYLYGYVTLGGQHSGWRGLFTICLAGAFGYLASAAHRWDLGLKASRPAWIALVLVTLFFAVQLSGAQIAAAWAVQGIVIGWISLQRNDLTFLRPPAEALLWLALVAALFSLGDLDPVAEPVLATPASIFTMIVVACAILAAQVVPPPDRGRRATPPVAWSLAAHVLAVLWLSQALLGEISIRTADSGDAAQFALTALWAAYAAGLLTYGIAARKQWPRLAGVALFGMTILKVIFSDVWRLETSYRILVFIGLGVVLLGASVAYERFRDLILERSPT
jgi:uncharacterized membrane protein